MKTAEQFNCLEIAAVRQETSQRSPEHGKNVYSFTLRFLQWKKNCKKALSKKKEI